MATLELVEQAEARMTHDRQTLQWTAGVMIEHQLRAMRVRKLYGGEWEPSDFFDLPRRVDLLEPDDPRRILRNMMLMTLMRGGTVPDSVRAALEEADGTE